MGVINLGWLIKKLKNKGFLTSTDYASATTAGVIRTSTTYATQVGTSGGSAGMLYGRTVTAANYGNMADQAFICKGTLENVKVPLTTNALAAIADADGSAASGTKWDTLVLEKTADGYTLSFKNTTTP